MDLLFQRYASPFIFLDGMLQSGRFVEFVETFVKTTNEEKEKEYEWEFFLHKVWNKSFKEFKEEKETNEKNRNLTARAIETTVQNSMDILNNFNPNIQGGES